MPDEDLLPWLPCLVMSAVHNLPDSWKLPTPKSYPAAMTEMRSSGTLGDLLASRRRRRVVGRESTTEVARAAFDSAKPPYVRLCRRGPGPRKARLLDSFPGLAADRCVSVTDNLRGKRRPRDAIGLLGTLTRL
jgi:hypothetical protein